MDEDTCMQRSRFCIETRTSCLDVFQRHHYRCMHVSFLPCENARALSPHTHTQTALSHVFDTRVQRGRIVSTKSFVVTFRDLVCTLHAVYSLNDARHTHCKRTASRIRGTEDNIASLTARFYHPSHDSPTTSYDTATTKSRHCRNKITTQPLYFFTWSFSEDARIGVTVVESHSDLGINNTSEHAINGWDIEWAAKLNTRFSVGLDGKTAYETKSNKPVVLRRAMEAPQIIHPCKAQRR